MNKQPLQQETDHNRKKKIKNSNIEKGINCNSKF